MTLTRDEIVRIMARLDTDSFLEDPASLFNYLVGEYSAQELPLAELQADLNGYGLDDSDIKSLLR